MRTSVIYRITLLGILLFAVGCPAVDDDDTNETVDYCTGEAATEVPSDWVFIEGGTFEMGSDDHDMDEYPIHTVEVPTFDMWRTEITVEQYARCWCAGECSEPGGGESRDNWEVPGREDHPINNVDWSDASGFCIWLGGNLPSEAEWEFSARSRGQNNTYPWGEDYPSCDWAVMTDNYHSSGCDLGHTWEVCGKTAGNTEQGLCDMSGNVWEWVQDGYHDGYDDSPTDGSAWGIPGNGFDGILRGGYFGNGDAYDMRTTHRFPNTYDLVSHSIGFRCTR